MIKDVLVELNPNTETSIKILEKLKHPGYLTLVEFELDIWNQTIAISMCYSNKKIWEHGRIKKLSNQVDSTFSRISKEVLDVFSDVSVGELKNVLFGTGLIAEAGQVSYEDKNRYVTVALAAIVAECVSYFV